MTKPFGLQRFVVRHTPATPATAPRHSCWLVTLWDVATLLLFFYHYQFQQCSPLLGALLSRAYACCTHCCCRLRTPNEWDSLTHWQDVLLWRNHIYNVVIGAFNNMQEIAPQLHQMGYRDKAWSVNKLGHIAYK